MSVNRSVQAAQRRRAVPQPTSSSSSNVQIRTPQPSINSAQAFANQVKGGPGPKIPSGRLSAQQLSKNQNQMMEDDSGSSAQNIQNISKMTVAQAITLITLRLGKLESNLQQVMMEGLSSSYQMSSGVGDNENMILVDKSVIESMSSRLESLEKRSTMPSGGRDLELLKQQFEPVRTTVAQNKTAIGALIRDHKDMKTQLSSMNIDLTETKELAGALRDLVMNNSQKLDDLHAMVGTNLDTDFQDSSYLGENTEIPEMLHGELIDEYQEPANSEVDTMDGEGDVDGEGQDLGTNLKELIEQELAGNS
jgi:hypothetical protein